MKKPRYNCSFFLALFAVSMFITEETHLLFMSFNHVGSAQPCMAILYAMASFSSPFSAPQEHEEREIEFLEYVEDEEFEEKPAKKSKSLIL